MYGVIPPPPPNGQLLDTRTSMGIHSVARAVNIISGTLAGLPIDVFRADVELEKPNIIRAPDVRMTLAQFEGLLSNNLAVHGNAYVRLHESVTQPGVTASMEILNPEFVRIEMRNGRKVFHYGSVEFADWQVEHVMINVGFDPGTNLVRGFSPIEVNRAELQGMLDLRNFASQWFRHAGIPTGILSTEQELDPETASLMRARWNEISQYGGIQILGNGLKFQGLTLNPEDAQFTAISQKAVTDVARMFGIPANLMLAEVNGTSTTYSNVQDNDRAFVKHTLMPYARAIEDLFTKVLPRGQYAKVNFGGFLRGDTKERYETHKVGIEAGFLTVDEARDLEDRAPLGGTPENT